MEYSGLLLCSLGRRWLTLRPRGPMPSCTPCWKSWTWWIDMLSLMPPPPPLWNSLQRIAPTIFCLLWSGLETCCWYVWTIWWRSATRLEATSTNRSPVFPWWNTVRLRFRTPFLHLRQCTVRRLSAHSDDAENYLHRNNYQVLGLPEGAEGDLPVDFAEAAFKDLLGLRQVSTIHVMERALHVHTVHGVPGALPAPSRFPSSTIEIVTWF